MRRPFCQRDAAWRLRWRADRIRRRPWPGLLLTIWGLGCAHPPAAAPRPSAQIVAPVSTTPHDEFRAVTVGDQQVLCAIRVGVDGSSFLLWPPVNHAARPACDIAYRAWQRSAH